MMELYIPVENQQECLSCKNQFSFTFQKFKTNLKISNFVSFHLRNEKTGAVLKTFAHNVSHDDIDENESITGVRTLLIGRTDYHVSAIDTKSGAVLWSLSSGE